MLNTPNMGLREWNLGPDLFDHTALSQNWTKVDAHDHTTGKGIQIPRAGIQNLAIDQSKLANLSVGTAQVQDGAITTVKLIDDAVTLDKIADAAVLNQHLASNAVTSAKIQDGTIVLNDLASAVLNNFIKSLSGTNRTLSAGVSGDFPGFNASGDFSTLTVNHGLGTTPTVAFACQADGGHASSGVMVSCSVTGRSSTQLTIGGVCTRQPIAPSVTANVFWVALT